MEKRQSLQQVVVGKWDTSCKWMKLEHTLILYTKINSKWLKDLNIKHDTIKLPERNIGKIFSDINCSNVLLGRSPKAIEIKAKINKRDLIKHKLFFFLKRLEFIYLFIYLFIYPWLCWVFISVRGPSPVAASGGHPSSRCAGLSLSRPLPPRSTGSRRAGPATMAHGPSRSAACGILPDQGPNPCCLHWQADSQPLRHQGSPQT